MQKSKIILSMATETHSKFKQICESKNLTMSSVLKMLIDEYLKKEKKQK